MTNKRRENFDDGIIKGTVIELGFTSEEIAGVDYCKVFVDDKEVGLFNLSEAAKPQGG